MVLLEREARIRLTSCHTIGQAAGYGQYMSLFAEPGQPGKNERPEDFPQEMNDAYEELMDQEARLAGLDPVADYEDEEPEEEDFRRQLDKLVEMIGGDDEDPLVFECEGVLRAVSEDGRVLIEVAYAEDESMDGTETVVRVDPEKPGMVTIYRTGGVVSALVCEEGKRHITVYETPICPFEIALYTKKCAGGISEIGGAIELDYVLEIRGADVQRTRMKIEVGIL